MGNNPQHEKFVEGAFYQNTAIRTLGGMCISVTAAGHPHFLISSEGEMGADSFPGAHSRPEWKEVWPVREPDRTATAVEVDEETFTAHIDPDKWAIVRASVPLKIFTSEPPPDFVWTPEKQAEKERTDRLKARGWFLPTRYHEEPGRYEDEHGQEWEFLTAPVADRILGGSYQWSWTKGRTVPAPTDSNDQLVHVRWVGDLGD